jgi:hypothetical protein
MRNLVAQAVAGLVLSDAILTGLRRPELPAHRRRLALAARPAQAIASVCVFWCGCLPAGGRLGGEVGTILAALSTELRRASPNWPCSAATAKCWKRRWTGSRGLSGRRFVPRCWSSMGSGPPGRPLSKRRSSSARAKSAAAKTCCPTAIAWFYPLSLLAQATPKHLELARKFCVAESGKRDPSPYGGWGRWVHAIDVRLGKDAALQDALKAHRTNSGALGLDSCGRSCSPPGSAVRREPSRPKAPQGLSSGEQRSMPCARLEQLPPAGADQSSSTAARRARRTRSARLLYRRRR